MNTNHIQSSFAAMGARFKTQMTADNPRGMPSGYALDIQRDCLGDYFELRVTRARSNALEVTVPQADKRDRHLLLFVRQPDGIPDRFLCGHDERAWFVAAVPGGASSVLQAKEALKPALVQARQNHVELPNRLRNRRRNPAFLRQGEWFFVPEALGLVNDKFILRHEPIRRGAGKPHIVEELYRTGGELVHVCTRHPNGLTKQAYTKLIESRPWALRWGWRVMRRNMRVYARGTVRHPDHATISLPTWHRVMMNTETQTDAMQNVAFID